MRKPKRPRAVLPYEPDMLEGKIIEQKPDAFFAVKIDDDRTLTCFVSRSCNLKKFPPEVGTRVRVEVSPYDSDKCRIRYVYQKPSQKVIRDKPSDEPAL